MAGLVVSIKFFWPFMLYLVVCCAVVEGFLVMRSRDGHYKAFILLKKLCTCSLASVLSTCVQTEPNADTKQARNKKRTDSNL